jgi:DNA-binding CsgD family transcriptional regulator
MRISLERYSELVGSVYDCAIDPSLWQTTLGDLARDLRFANSVVALHAVPSGESLMLSTTGIPAEWQLRMNDDIGSVYELWGGVAKAVQFPVDEPVVQSHQTPRDSWESNAWYKNWVEPQGLFDAVAMKIAEERTLFGSLTFGRMRAAGEIGEDELAPLRLLAPHFRRAVTISNLLDLKTVLASTFAATLDALAAGVFLVGADLRLVYHNPAAGSLIRPGGPLDIAGGRLRITADPAATASLEAAIGVAARDESALGRKGMGVPLRGMDGNPLLIHVLPLKRGDIRPELEQRAIAALFVTPAANEPQLPADALALLYELTPAETRILLLVAGGMEQARVAETLGIAPATVKTHLQHVFDKTGCRRQADLVKLAASMSPPVR